MHVIPVVSGLFESEEKFVAVGEFWTSFLLFADVVHAFFGFCALGIDRRRRRTGHEHRVAAVQMVVMVIELVLSRSSAVSQVPTTTVYSTAGEIDERGNVDTGYVRSSQTWH